MHFDDWTDTPSEERVKKAISGLVLDHCFYGAIALHLDHRPDPTCETMWVDGITVGYNPEYVQELSLPKLRFVQAHEYTHVANKHHLRRGNRDQKLWNEACDYVINLMLKDAGFKLPPDLLYDTRFIGMSAEQVYAILDDKKRQEEKEEKKEDPQNSSDDGNGPGEDNPEDQGGDKEDQDQTSSGGGDKDDNKDETGEQAGSGEGEDEGEDEGEGEGDESEGDGEGDGEGEGDESNGDGEGEVDESNGEGDESRAGSDDATSGNGGDPNAVGDVGGCGEVRDAPDQTETGIREEEAKWDIIVTQAAKLSERIGDMPAGMKRMIDEVLGAKVHWQEALSRWIVEQADTDYSWKRPNRRYISQDIYLPSLQGDELLPIAFMVDTSGSQDARAINQCASEIQAALSCYFTEFSVPVIYCDAAVQGVDEIDGYGDVELNPVGGGGTDFRPPFQYIEDEQIDIEGAIYLTDGHCYSFPNEPDYPVLWVITPRGKRNFEPPFGEVISMND